jgi:hypothetical protein
MRRTTGISVAWTGVAVSGHLMTKLSLASFSLPFRTESVSLVSRSHNPNRPNQICSSDGSMADGQLLQKIHELSDLELAALLCLITQEHCIIDTEPDALHDVVHELKLVRKHPETSTLHLLINGRLLPMSSGYPTSSSTAQSTPPSTTSTLPSSATQTPHPAPNPPSAHDKIHTTYKAQPSAHYHAPQRTPNPSAAATPAKSLMSSSPKTSTKHPSKCRFKPWNSFAPSAYIRTPRYRMRRRDSS